MPRRFVVEREGRRFVVEVPEAPEAFPGSVPSEIRQRSLLSHPAARFAAGAAGVGGGAALGAQVGGAMGAAFPPAAPFTTGAGAVIGAGIGHMAAQQARRFGAAAMEYDQPEARGRAMFRSLGAAPQDIAEGAVAELGGRGLAKVGQMVAPYFRGGYLQARELITGVHEAPGVAASERVLQRGRQIIQPEFREGVPESISMRVQRGVNVHIERARQEYQQATPKIRAQMETRYVQIGPSASTFRQSLIDMGIMDASGRPLTGLLPSSINPAAAREHAQLIQALTRLEQETQRVRPGRFGGRAGFVRADQVHRTIRQIDDAVSYSRRGVNPIGDQGEAMLKGLRRHLMDQLGEEIPALARRNSRYAEQVELFEEVQKRLTNESVATTIKGMAVRGNEFPYPQLRQIDQKLPKSARFMETVQDFLAGRTFAGAKGLGRLGLQLYLPGVGVGAMFGHPLAAAATLAPAVMAMSPRLYARELGVYRAMAPMIRRVAPAFQRALAPAIGGTEAALIGQE